MKGLPQVARPRHGRIPSTLRATLGGLALIAAPTAAAAGGLVLPGSGPVSTGRAGASVSSIDDPSAIGINPARLAAVPRGTTIHIGAAMFDYRMKFTRAGTYDDVIEPERTDPWEGQPYPTVEDESSPAIGLGGFQAVPVIAVASDLGGAVKGLTVAAGVFAPNAYPVRSYGADYDLTDLTTAPPPTRYDTVEQEATVVLPSIAVAYAINDKLSIGARFSSGFGHIKAKTTVWGLDNLDEWAGRDSTFSVDVKDSFVPAFGVGAHYAITDAIEVGASWNSGYTVNGKGSGTTQTGVGIDIGGVPITVLPNNETPLCAPGGTPEALKACVTVRLPWMATVGGRYVIRDAGGDQVADVELNVDYEAWSGASDYDVIVDGIAAVDPGPPPIGLPLQPTKIKHNLKDTISVRLGGSWQKALGFGKLVVRGGVAHDTAAAKEGWERVDFDGAARTTVAVGASVRLSKVQIDLGGGIAYEGTRTQGTGCNPAVIGEGCTPGSPQDGINDRPGPDPIQPTKDIGGQAQSPFNEGKYESGYTLLMLGVSTWF